LQISNLAWKASFALEASSREKEREEMKKLATIAISFFLTIGAAFADTPKDANPGPAKPAEPGKPKAAKKAEKSDAAIAAQLEELRQALQSQQEQLAQLKEELAKRDHQIDEAREAAGAANARAAEASTKAIEAVNTTAEVKSTAVSLNSTVSDLKASNEALKTTVATEQAEAKKAEETGPASIKIKGITLTPGGFLAAESVWRQRAVSGDVNTPLTGIPFPNNPLSKTTEFNASGRQSRLTLLVEGKADKINMTGYYELDWLGACATSNNRQSNSYCMRQRQIWGSGATPGGWYVSGGQMWSLATEHRKGLTNRQEIQPMTIDAQYVAGYTWARQFGFRVVKNFEDKFSLGFSIEGSQTTFGGRGAATAFFINAPGAGGGLFNATDGTGYTLNKSPDFIVKAAVDRSWGHAELFGIVSTFRARVYPCSTATVAAPCPGFPTVTAPSVVGAFDDTRTGGGGGANIRVYVANKKVELGVHGVYGDGIGRYGSAQLADVTARPDGTLAPIRTGHGEGIIEIHATPKLDLYFYGGGEYAFRTAYNRGTAAAPIGVGYGSPFFNNSGCTGPEGLPTNQNTPNSAGTCNGDVRLVTEGTAGFWQKFYNGPKGRLQWGLQFSYLQKNTWSGNNNTPAAVGLAPKVGDTIIMSAFRYYLP